MSVSNDVSPYAILTFPRSGSHQIQNILLARFGIQAKIYHDLEEISNQDKVIISVVRNPLECMTSILSRTIALITEIDILSILQNNPSGDQSDELTDKFIKTMNDIDNNADIIIDFNELVNDMEATISKLSTSLGLPSFDNGHDLTVQSGVEPDNFMASSRVIPAYDAVYDVLSNNDLSIATAAYQQVLAKAI